MILSYDEAYEIVDELAKDMPDVAKVTAKAYTLMVSDRSPIPSAPTFSVI